MSISLTPSAAKHITKHIESHQGRQGLRVSVKNSGCSGYTYELAYVDEIQNDDCVFESHGVKVVVKQEHLKILNDVQLDYQENGLSSAFKFSNPNAINECGCGESFAVN